MTDSTNDSGMIHLGCRSDSLRYGNRSSSSMNAGKSARWLLLLLHHALQFSVNLSLFPNRPPLASISWLTSPVPHTHILQIFLPLANPRSCCIVFVVSVRFLTSEASQGMLFMGWGCQPHVQPPTWRTSLSLLAWVITFDLSGMGRPTNSDATTSIAVRIIWPHKTRHYVKVWTPSGRGGGLILWEYLSLSYSSCTTLLSLLPLLSGQSVYKLHAVFRDGVQPNTENPVASEPTLV